MLEACREAFRGPAKEYGGPCWNVMEERAVEGVPLACQGVPELGCWRAREKGRSDIWGLAVQKKGKWFGEVGQGVAFGAVITDAETSCGKNFRTSDYIG